MAPVVATIDDAITEDTFNVLVVVTMSTKVLLTMVVAIKELTLRVKPLKLLKEPLSMETLVPTKVDVVRVERTVVLSAVIPVAVSVLLVIVLPIKVLYFMVCVTNSVVLMELPVNVLYSTVCAERSTVEIDEPVNVEYSML